VSLVFLVAGSTHLYATGFLAVPAILTGVVAYLALARHFHAAPTARAAQQGKRQDDWPGFALLSSLVVVRSIVYFGLTSLIALYVGTALHAGKQVGELALTTLIASGAAGTVTGGRLADRYGRLPVTRASIAGTAAGLVAVVLTPYPWVFLPIVLTGFSLFQSFSLTVTLGQDYLPTRIGTSSGVTLGLAISVGGLLAPALGALADATSLRLALIVLLVFLPVGLAVALRMWEPRTNLPAPSRPLVPAAGEHAGGVHPD
ncbi:MAG TPA: MFS transporter, partial [Acidimicrobiales bacterium]|nr:MFS transporter [Acidimicrobiales bacterium]